MRKFGLIALIFWFSIQIIAQNYPKDFIKPLKIPIALVANFGELRNNHFHTGLDIRTQQRPGLTVVSVADGYVSRIAVSPYGNGKALYIAHPNGYTSVYCHLDSFSDKIEEYARKVQYNNKSYKIDFSVMPNELKVSQGEQIALSGNTGGSGGPHVHFEIRSTETEEVYNPYLFGFDVPDTQKPLVSGVWIYDFNDFSPTKKMVNFNAKTEITAGGKIGFGVKAYDKNNTSPSLDGIYTIKTFVNDSLISYFQADKISFDQVRAINAVLDYDEFSKKNNRIYQTFRLEGNQIPFYKKLKDEGYLEVKEDSLYRVKIEVGDFAGNITTENFTIKGTHVKEKIFAPVDNGIVTDKPFSFSKDGLKINLEENSIYRDILFDYKYENGKYYVHHSNVPLHKKYELSIIPQKGKIIDSLAKHYIIMRTNDIGKYQKEYLETSYENGTYKAFPKDFGIFSLVLDSIKPTISCSGLTKSKKVSKRLNISIKDTISGINTYDVYIDDKWILAEYEYKNNLLFIRDLNKEGILPGSHELKVIVTDNANNEQIYTNSFEKL